MTLDDGASGLAIAKKALDRACCVMDRRWADTVPDGSRPQNKYPAQVWSRRNRNREFRGG